MIFEYEIAEAVKEAVRIREDSFDSRAAAAVIDKRLDEFTDFVQFYRLSYLEAVTEAIKSAGLPLGLVEPIRKLLELSWQEIYGWSVDVSNIFDVRDRKQGARLGHKYY